MVPSMSVVRAAVEQEERVAAPLVRTKDNFFSFFNKKKNKERRKTPPKRPLDQDLPVADVGKLKSEESLRWSSKGKFPWSPGPGKKNPPLSMSTSSPRSSPTPGVHSPQYRSKGRNRTASTGENLIHLFFFLYFIFYFFLLCLLILTFLFQSPQTIKMATPPSPKAPVLLPLPLPPLPLSTEKVPKKKKSPLSSPSLPLPPNPKNENLPSETSPGKDRAKNL